MRTEAPERDPLPASEVPTIRQCDQVLRRYSKELHKADGDVEQEAIIRYELDRWLDLRLALMKHSAA